MNPLLTAISERVSPLDTVYSDGRSDSDSISLEISYPSDGNLIFCPTNMFEFFKLLKSINLSRSTPPLAAISDRVSPFETIYSDGTSDTGIGAIASIG